MSEHYDFHYQPTGSGAISGQQVLEQTEDAINELGDYVNDNVGGAMDVAQQALETAQNAEQDAQTALDTANSFSSAIQSAQQDASTALSTAQTAQTTASNANNTAIQAQQDASSAVTTANNASGQVSTLSGTVTTLGQRVTTAEGNIGQNTSDITALTTRVGTAEGNITTLQNDVSIAQGNASSAMATAGQVKQQAFVFRYSSTALTASSTNSNTLLDNTDNLKVGDKVIDSDGVLFSITAIDTQNSTFTIGTALIDLAQDSDVVHKSGNETKSGELTLSDTLNSSDIVPIANNSYSSGSSNNQWNNLYAKNYYYNGVAWGLDKENTWSQNQIISSSSNRTFAIKSTTYTLGETTPSANKVIGSLAFKDNNNENAAYIDIGHYQSGDIFSRWLARYKFQDGVKSTTGSIVNAAVDLGLTNSGVAFLRPYSNNFIALGDSTHKWKTLNGVEPSSLSLPSGNVSDAIDISSYLVNLDGTDNTYIAPANGWISITMSNCSGIQAYITGLWGHQIVRPTVGDVRFLMPVLKNLTASIFIFGGTIDNARFIPCQGNV